MDGQPILSEPRVIAVPSDRAWFDPRLIGAVCVIQTFDYSQSGVDALQVALANPNRISLGITADTTFIAAPWPGASPGFYVTTVTGQSMWVTLHTHQTLVCLPWYALGSMGANYRVVEITRRI